MSDGRNSDKPEVKQEERPANSVWSEIARDVVVDTLLGAAGLGVSKAITAGLDAAQSKAAADQAEALGRGVMEAALPLVTMGIGAGFARGAVKGAESALKAGANAEESTLDKTFDLYKAAHGETLPFFLLGPLALMPQVREPIKQADGVMLDKIRSVSESMFDKVKKEPWRFAAMSVGSPLIPVLDAIINNE